MAQLATVLDHDGLLNAAQGGPSYKTTVFDGATGLEKRTIVWSTPRRVWQITLRGKLSEFTAFLALFDEAKGQAYSFLWTPPGYSQGDFRFGVDALAITLNNLGVSGDYLATISVPLIEALGE